METSYTPDSVNTRLLGLPYQWMDTADMRVDKSKKLGRAFLYNIFAEAPIVTATAAPTFEPAKQEVSSTSNTTTSSNKGMYKRPFSFNGRIRRTEYCLSFIIYMIWYGVINAMM